MCFQLRRKGAQKFLLPRSALTAPMTGKRLYMSLCISLNVMFDFSAHFLPLKGAPLLSVHIGEPSLHSGKNRPKFSAGRTCSHSTLLALFLWTWVVKPGGREIHLSLSNGALQ